MEFGILVASHTIRIGSVELETANYTFESVSKTYENDPEIRCIDDKTSDMMKSEIDKARLEKNTLGGTIEIIARNTPVGLGSYVQWDRKIDGQLAGALMSIPSVKAIEIGTGVENSAKKGSMVHDAIYFNSKFYRKTNRAGGIEGGVTNGEDIILRVYHKPISTLGNPLKTVDLKSRKQVKALIERSDICVVPRAGVISESMVCFILARTLLEKFGSDNISDMKMNYQYYSDRI